MMLPFSTFKMTYVRVMDDKECNKSHPENKKVFKKSLY